MNFIRLLEITGHLGEKLIHGYSDIHSKSQSVPNRVFDCRGKSQRFPTVTYKVAYVHIGFIYGRLLNLICVLFENVNKLSGIHSIGLKIRLYQNKLGTFFQSSYDRFSSLDMICLCWYGFCCYDSVAGLNIAPNR